MIQRGRVRINGTLVTSLPAWADPQRDRIEVDGRPLPRPRQGSKTDRVYVALHKPKRVISTTDDPQGRKSVTDLIELPPSRLRRLYPVGRLDAESTGLILLTNDGELANRLTHPRYGVTKRYHVTVQGRLEEQDVHRLRKGLMLTQGPAHREDPAALGGQSQGKPPVKRAMVSRVKLIGYEKDPQGGQRTALSVELREGQNREIRRLMARLGFKVRRLRRVAIGPLTVKGLGVGQWRQLRPAEVKRLRKAAKLSDAAPQGEGSSEPADTRRGPARGGPREGSMAAARPEEADPAAHPGDRP
jgi:pseudouridine synthase